MTRVSPRPRLHSSELLRLLSRQGLIDDSVDPGDVGVRLGDWLDFRQAIALQSLIGQLEQPSAPVAATARVDAQVLQRRLREVRQALERAITDGTPAAAGLPRIDWPGTELAQPIDTKTAFDPFRRCVQGQQRQMEQVLRSLRSQLRHMLGTGTAAQRQLAALDALLENVLSPRETRLLGQITNEHEKRFARQLRRHLQQQVAASEADEPAPRTTPWLAPLREDLRQALLAELDLRLQPLLGLAEALTTPTVPSV